MYLYSVVCVQVTPKKKGASSKSSPEKTPAATTPRNVAAVSAALAAGVPAGQLVFISVADPGCLARIPDPNFFPSLIPLQFCPKNFILTKKMVYKLMEI
jgi:hypothetical protein